MRRATMPGAFVVAPKPDQNTVRGRAYPSLEIVGDLMRGGRHCRKSIARYSGKSLPTADRWIVAIRALIPGIVAVRVGKTLWIEYRPTARQEQTMSKGTSRANPIEVWSCNGQSRLKMWVTDGEVYTEVLGSPWERFEWTDEKRAGLIRALGGIAKSEVTPEMVDALRSALRFIGKVPTPGYIDDAEPHLDDLLALLTEDTNA